MFEIRCIVGGKKGNLEQVLMALHGLTLEPPVVIPVVPNVDGVALRSPKPQGNARDHILEYLKKHRSKQVSVKVLADHLVSFGFHRNGYSYGVQQLAKDGILKKTSTVGVYNVVL